MFLNKILITHHPTLATPRLLCCGGLSQQPGHPVHPLSPAVPQPTLRNPYNPTKLDLQAGIVDKWFRTQPGVIRDAHLGPHCHGTKVDWSTISSHLGSILHCLISNIRRSSLQLFYGRHRKLVMITFQRCRTIPYLLSLLI